MTESLSLFGQGYKGGTRNQDRRSVGRSGFCSQRGWDVEEVLTDNVNVMATNVSEPWWWHIYILNDCVRATIEGRSLNATYTGVRPKISAGVLVRSGNSSAWCF
ncbi:hypothetical protein JB92DRAFT_3000742 [Gautieria morchelliformis]|nr:hypothetical protein JB92DRAFT_3000742 [Gautieria morchelliformis]